MNEYALGEKRIKTTEEKYNKIFKGLGYKPVEEKKSVKTKEPKEEKVEEPTIKVDED